MQPFFDRYPSPDALVAQIFICQGDWRRMLTPEELSAPMPTWDAADQPLHTWLTDHLCQEDPHRQALATLEPGARLTLAVERAADIVWALLADWEGGPLS